MYERDPFPMECQSEENGIFIQFPGSMLNVHPSFGRASNRGDFPRRGGYHPSSIYAGVVIRPQALIYVDSIIRSGTFIGDQAIVREFTEIGENCIIGAGSIIENNCFIGNNVRIMTRVYLCAYSHIENDCFIGPCVVTTNDRYMGTGDPERRRRERKGLRTKQGARLGAGVLTLPGVTVGTGVIIGAGGIVTKDILEPGVYVETTARLERLREQI